MASTANASSLSADAVVLGSAASAAIGATEWAAYRDNFLEANFISTTVTFFCCVSIALSSRYLYANVAVSKMPLAAAISWFLSSLLFGLKIYSNNAPIGLYVCGPASWLADYVTRCLVLWFTYYRTLAVWPNAALLTYMVAAMQIASLGPFGYVLYVSAPNGPVATNSVQYNDGASIYIATDLFSSVFDILLLGRLWALNAEMRKSPLNADLVNPRFFGFSIACLSFILVMSCAMISVFLTANDPYWSWYSILFSFRLQLTDVFSNLLRDSLIEARFESTKGMRLPHDNSYLNKQQLMPSAPAPSRQSHAVVIQTLSLQTESSGSTTQKAPNNQLGPPKMQTSTGGTPNLASPKRRQPQSRDGQSLPKDQTALLSRRLSTGSIIPSPPESLDSLVQAR